MIFFHRRPNPILPTLAIWGHISLRGVDACGGWMFPVRCYTCNVVLAQHHPEYSSALARGRHPGETLDALGVKRMCCRRMFLSYVDLYSEQIKYPNTDMVLDEGGSVLRRLCKHERTASCD